MWTIIISGSSRGVNIIIYYSFLRGLVYKDHYLLIKCYYRRKLKLNQLYVYWVCSGISS